MNDYSVLASRIRQATDDLERVVNRAEALMQRAETSGDDGYLDGAALNLHGFYAGMERIFEDIARTIDMTVPDGPEWHRTLLLQMSGAVDGVRPEVISQQSRYCLDEYRGFRHVVRNVYTFRLRPSRITELTAELRACYTQVSADLHRFIIFLQQLDESEG